jgi:predicted nucleic acid-binding protein
MMIFVDTGAWFSWFVLGDQDHAAVAEAIDGSDEPLLTTDYCIDETLTLLVARNRLNVAIDAGRFFFEENQVTLHFVTAEQIHRAWILFRQRVRAGWSFTDCTSKIVIDDLRIQTAVALDDHFRQFGISVVP